MHELRLIKGCYDISPHGVMQVWARRPIPRRAKTGLMNPDDIELMADVDGTLPVDARAAVERAQVALPTQCNASRGSRRCARPTRKRSRGRRCHGAQKPECADWRAARAAKKPVQTIASFTCRDPLIDTQPATR
jgi:hypothetical protein